MIASEILVFSALVSLISSNEMQFPASFQFGVATASYQIEGAWNVSDKGESIYDRFTHRKPSAIADGSTGDVACDSYHLWRRDIGMCVELGIDLYRLSISWPRLLPDGFPDKISEDGKNYYSNLIDGLLEKGIQPVVTLFHWDLPQRVQDLGGWTNPITSDWFADYARVVFSLYADRVKIWITINEPYSMCDIAYGFGKFAPGVTDAQIGVYLCNKHVLVGHAKAWRIYDEEFKPKYHGKVSIAHHLIWFQPSSPKDQNLTDLVTEYVVGRYTHPIYSETGGWPPAIEEVVRKASTKEGYPRSRLPTFTNDEIQLVRGSYDFFGINHYTSLLVHPAQPGEDIWSPFSGVPVLNAALATDPSWHFGYSNKIAGYLEGLRKQLAWLKRNYGQIDILITENGYYTKTDNSLLCDQDRITYIKRYLEQVLLSIWVDGVKVIGYIYWSLLDNFEWSNGYTDKYGLYSVDFDSPLRTRTPRTSALYYKNIVKSRSLAIPSNLHNK